MMEMTRLQYRVLGRLQARELLELVELTHPEMVASFLDEMKSSLQPEQVKKEKVVRQRKLSELKAHVLGFGVHANECLDDIPRDYLEWLLGETEGTLQIVSQYLQMTAEPDALNVD